MPSGTPMRDGHQTLITFADFPNIQLFEKEVTPPGLDGGGPNDTSGMRNSTRRSRQPKKLTTTTPMSGTCYWDPLIYDTIHSIVNHLQVVTVTLPNGGEVSDWGWLDKFTPNAHKEGEAPTANFVVEFAGEDEDGVETELVYDAP
jgi:hypothetical protein